MKRQVFAFDIYDDSEECELSNGHIVAWDYINAENLLLKVFNRSYSIYKYTIYDLDEDEQTEFFSDGKKTLGVYNQFSVKL